MRIKEVKAKAIRDSRNEKTVCVFVKTQKGTFQSSAPSGESRGRYEAKPYKNTLVADLSTLNKFSGKLSKLRVDSFNELEKIEKIIKNKIGANSLIALEYSVLKAIAAEQNLQLWELLLSKKMQKNKNKIQIPFFVGNCIGGGLHSHNTPKPDFQEFLFIPEAQAYKSLELNQRAWQNAQQILRNIDKKFKQKKNDENAWQTSLTDEQVLTLMQDIKENMLDEFGITLHIGIDFAASTFFNLKTKKYTYKNTNAQNSKKTLNKPQQIQYITDLIKKYKIFYAEDPLQQEDFSGFAQVNKQTRKNCLIVGDDLTATDLTRLRRAIKFKSINAIIIKPNQNGSLLEVKKVIDLAKRKAIKTIISHRSGDTLDSSIADLAVAWQADFIKSGIIGKEREAKLKKLIKIEETL